jgi:hypothetical protein
LGINDDRWTDLFSIWPTPGNADGRVSSSVGRANFIVNLVMDVSFDLEYPLEVDDEYWEHPNHPFVQPSGKPSVISGWVHYLKLMVILGLIHRGIVSRGFSYQK